MSKPTPPTPVAPDKAIALIARAKQERAAYLDLAQIQMAAIQDHISQVNARVLDLVEVSGHEELLPDDLKPALDARLGRTPPAQPPSEAPAPEVKHVDG